MKWIMLMFVSGVLFAGTPRMSPNDLKNLHNKRAFALNKLYLQELQAAKAAWKGRYTKAFDAEIKRITYELCPMEGTYTYMSDKGLIGGFAFRKDMTCSKRMTGGKKIDGKWIFVKENHVKCIWPDNTKDNWFRSGGKWSVHTRDAKGQLIAKGRIK